MAFARYLVVCFWSSKSPFKSVADWVNFLRPKLEDYGLKNVKPQIYAKNRKKHQNGQGQVKHSKTFGP